jgi:predicted HicB family RNase H-like nuclease
MATKTTTLSVRLGPKLREQLEHAATEVEMTLGEFVRYVLAEHLKHRP